MARARARTRATTPRHDQDDRVEGRRCDHGEAQRSAAQDASSSIRTAPRQRGRHFSKPIDAVNVAAHERFLMDAVLSYDGADAAVRRASARALLAQHPELPDQSIWAAAAAGDHRALVRFLSEDPSSARLVGGPKNWEPLLYLTYARLGSPTEADDLDRCLQALLDAGADPNAGYLVAAGSTPFTALTGLFGGGEGDDTAQPAHPQFTLLATHLLTAGAEPNDGQTLYNRMFGPADDHLELLFAHGLGTGDGGPWHRRDPLGTDTPEQMLRGQLAWAVTHGFTHRIRLLARHGVDLRSPLDAGHLPMRTTHTPLQLAVIAGSRQSADTLRALGVDDRLDPVTELIGALLDADDDTVARLEAEHPELLATVRRTNPSLILRAAAADRPAAIEVLVGRGFDVDALGRADIVAEQPWETALHHAAGAAKADIVQALLRCGADRHIRDRRFGATPADWAKFFDHAAVAALLE